jgi:hypothetical protein
LITKKEEIICIKEKFFSKKIIKIKNTNKLLIKNKQAQKRSFVTNFFCLLQMTWSLSVSLSLLFLYFEFYY